MRFSAEKSVLFGKPITIGSVVFATGLVAYLDYWKFITSFKNFDGSTSRLGFATPHALSGLWIGLLAVIVLTAAAALWTIPPLHRAAGRSPLHALALAGATAATFSLGALWLTGGRGLDVERIAGIGATLLVALLVTHEGLLLAASPRHATARQAAGDQGGGLAGIRAVLFLFMMAEELSRSFLPLYARDLGTTIPGLTDGMAMSLPIGLFMLLVTVFTPFAGAWTDRFGSRRTLLVGSLPAVAGFAGTAAAHGLVELLLWRGGCALGYAVMFIGAQGFIARHTAREGRARGMARFVAAVVVAGLCGAPIGGILADHLGPRATFAVSAVLALASAVAAWRLLPNEAPERAKRHATRWRDYGLPLANRRFAALLLFSSIPTKLMLTGYLFYLVPVTLHGFGESPAAIGRIMMAYGLTIVLLGPWVSRAADRTGRHALLCGIGGLVSGTGTLVVLQAPGPLAVLAGVAALGVAHAFNNATQLALVPELCRDESARIGGASVFAVYRLVERGGSVLGPPLAAALADRLGARMALGALGALSLVTGVAFCVTFLLTPASLTESSLTESSLDPNSGPRGRAARDLLGEEAP